MLSVTLLLLLAWPTAEGARLGELTVARGRSACLDPGDPHLPLSGGHLCRMEVIRSRYMDHTVGNIYPTSFNCSFRRGQVCYEHSGAPHLSVDLVPIRIIRYTQEGSTSEIRYLQVNIVDAEYKYIGPAQSWSVPSTDTTSNGLSSAGFELKYRQIDSNCFMTLNPKMSEYPVVGAINGVLHTRTNISKTDTGSGVSRTYGDCYDFIVRNLKYRYTDVLSLTQDFVPIEVKITNISGNVESERYFAPVQLRSTTSNKAPKVTRRGSFSLRVKPFATRILDPEFALAVDDTTPQDALHFVVQNMSDPAAGYFAYRHDPMQPIFSFSQAEARSHQIVFKSMKQSQNPITITMVVVDLEFGVSSPMLMPVQVNDYKTKNIEVHLVKPLRLPKGMSAKVTSDHLKIKITGERDVRLVVRDGLYYGTLTVRGRKTHKFTPDDLRMGQVVYTHSGESLSSDYIMIRLKDGKKKRARVTIPINIVQIINSLPELVNNSVLTCREGQMSPITRTHLSTDTANMSKINFVISGPPTFGHIMKLVGTQFVTDILKFNGDDIMRNVIFYQHITGGDTKDGFIFHMEDGYGGMSNDHKFTINVHESLGKLERLPSTQTSLVTRWQIPATFTKAHIQYSSSNGPVRYKITKQPFSRGEEQTNNCGKIIMYTDRHKASGVAYQMLGPVYRFTQEDIDSGSIMYAPAEVSPSYPQELTFAFDVSDSTGNTMVNQLYNITVKDPDMAPEWHVEVLNPVIVHEGESVLITRDDFNITTLGNNMPRITFKLVAKPQWGMLEKWSPVLGKQENWDSFTLEELNERAITYRMHKHSGAEPMSDSVKLLVSGGDISIGPLEMDFIVIPRNDEVPKVNDDELMVEEGGTMVITKDTLPVKDMDIPADQLTVEILQQPKWGRLILTKVDNKTGQYVTVPAQTFTKQSLGKDTMLSYKHDGSENFSDEFKVNVSDNKFSSEGSIKIKIQPVNDEIPELVVNSELPIESGESVEISQNELKTVDLDNRNSEIYYLIFRTPVNGKLQIKKPRADGVYLRSTPDIHWSDLKAGQNFTQEDIDKGHVRYSSRKQLKNDDNFMFIVSDGAHALPHATFKFINSFPTTSPPVVDNQNEQRYKPENANNVLDKVTSRPEMTKPPKNPTLTDNENDDAFLDDDYEEAEDDWDQVVKKEEFDFAASSSLSTETYSERRYVIKPAPEVSPSSVREAERRNDIATLPVPKLIPTSDPSLNKRPVTKPDETLLKLPNLVANEQLTVRKGGIGIITKEHLRITINQADVPDTALKYVIIRRPDHGVLFRELHEVNSYFTQSDVDKEHITYKHMQDDSQEDQIVFRITDGVHDRFLVNGSLDARTVTFRIHIKKPADQPPTLTFPKPFSSLERLGRNRYAYRLTPEQLLAQHPDALSSEITYNIKERPAAGYLEYVSNGRIVNRRFTQQDVDKADIRYVINKDSAFTNDTFVVNLMDPWGHMSADFSVALSWSVVQFMQPEYLVCEDVGSFVIAIGRSGNLDQPCKVQVKIKSMTARLKDDFMVHSGKEVYFEPGEKLIGWKVSVNQDNEWEDTEKFRVMLRSPTNTMIGPAHRTVVHLVDFRYGRCDEYLGMISKDEPNPLGLVFQAKAKVFTTPTPGTPRVTWFAPQDSERDRGSRRKSKGRKSRKRKAQTTEVPQTTTTGMSTTTEYQPGSQPCTKHRRGLVFFDMATQNLFKCDGQRWLRQYHRFLFMPQNLPAAVEEVRECPSDWEEYENKCYLLYKTKVSWFTAQKDCRQLHGGHVVSVTSQRHLHWLVKLAGSKHFWTGLNNRKTNGGAWQNDDGQEVKYEHWKKGYPKKEEQRNCVLVNHKGDMVNKPCHRPIARYICAKVLTI